MFLFSGIFSSNKSCVLISFVYSFIFAFSVLDICSLPLTPVYCFSLVMPYDLSSNCSFVWYMPSICSLSSDLSSAFYLCGIFHIFVIRQFCCVLFYYQLNFLLFSGIFSSNKSCVLISFVYSFIFAFSVLDICSLPLTPVYCFSLVMPYDLSSNCSFVWYMPSICSLSSDLSSAFYLCGIFHIFVIRQFCCVLFYYQLNFLHFNY